MRTDIHRPSVIAPEDYEYVAQEHMKISDLGDCLAIQAERKIIEQHMARTGGTYSRHQHGGNCHVCGASAVYTVLFYHAATNTYVRTGQDCAAKLGYDNPNAFRTFRKSVQDALQLKAGKAKARATLGELGLERCWDIYTAEWSPAPGCRQREIIADIVGKLVVYGSISGKQSDFLAKLLEDEAKAEEVAAARAAAHAAAAPAPAGRRTVEVEVLSVRAEENPYVYGAVLTTKMLVKHADGWKAFGTAPRSIEGDVKKGDHVRLTATFSPKDDDPKFAIFKRPIAEITHEAPQA